MLGNQRVYNRWHYKSVNFVGFILTGLKVVVKW